jgi:hypothetical protein
MCVIKSADTKLSEKSTLSRGISEKWEIVMVTKKPQEGVTDASFIVGTP